MLFKSSLSCDRRLLNGLSYHTVELLASPFGHHYQKLSLDVSIPDYIAVLMAIILRVAE